MAAAECRKRTPDEFVTRPDLELILNDLKSECTATAANVMNEATKQMEQRMGEAMARAIRNADSGYQNRFGMIEDGMKGMADKFARLEKAHDDMQKSLADVKKSVAAAEPLTPRRVQEDLDMDEFERQPDPTIIKIRTADGITLGAMKEALKEMMFNMDLKDDQYEVSGQTLDRNFVIKFGGATGLAARRARKFMGMQRVGTGWVELMANTPDGAQTRVFFDIDKNRKQARKEMLSRRLCKVLRDKYPAKDFFNKERDAVIGMNFVPLARVIVDGPEDHRLEWNLQLLNEQGIDREMVGAELNSSMADGSSGITWG